MANDQLLGAIRTVPDFPKPGIQFKDITPILKDVELLRQAVKSLAAPFEQANIDKVVGMESRGFILGAMLADHLGAGFVPVRKKGKLPYQTIAETYALEYGTDELEMHIDALTPGERVLIHDDVIATGGTAAATANLVKRSQGHILGYSFLIELAFLNGKAKLSETVHAVLTY
ncbi:MAG: adenine phosphoribosyltransferase [Bacteroidota bacterium]